jgi:AcrR family transcriptional regulator
MKAYHVRLTKTNGGAKIEAGRESSKRRTSAETREHVLRVARELFYWEGIHATGVDRVASEAGVAPTTLYRLFASKDDLVAAYVEREDRLFREWFEEAVEAGGPGTRGRILALFDALADQVRPERCRGCPFQMALTEFPDAAMPARTNAVANKAWVRARLGDLVGELVGGDRADDPAALADELALLVEGVYASAQSSDAGGAAARARALSERLLAATGR